jgi:hypothetical protein
VKREELLGKLVQGIIAIEIASYFNNELVATPFYKQDLKFAINKLKPILIKNGVNEFDRLFDKNEEVTNELFDVLLEMIKFISGFGMHRFGEVTEFLKIYDKEFQEQNK